MQLLRRLMLPMLCMLLLIGSALCEEPAPMFAREDSSYAITIRSVEQNEAGDLILSVCCENRTDHPLTFGWSQVSVMGSMIDPLWAATVEADTTQDSEIRFEARLLQKAGVDQVGEISFTLTVLDAFAWDKASLLEEECTLYPYGEQPELIDRLHTPEETVLIDSDELLLVLLNTEEVPLDGCVLNVCLQNRTDRYAMAKIINATANGAEVDPMWAGEMCAGKRLYAQIKIPQYQLSAARITRVEELSFTMQLHDLTDWMMPVMAEYDVILISNQNE